jgi:transposase
MVVADIREILVQWDAGEELSRIARALGYSRPTVRKYVRAAERAGLTPQQRRRDAAEGDQLAAAAIAQVAHQRPPGAVRQDVARYRSYLEQHVGQVQLSVLHQRLRDEQGLQASWGSFYRYVRATWPDRMARTPQATIRLDDPPPGAEAQVDFFYGVCSTRSFNRQDQQLYPVLWHWAVGRQPQGWRHGAQLPGSGQHHDQQ